MQRHPAVSVVAAFVALTSVLAVHTGCDGAGEVCAGASDLAPGTVEAQIDGQAWSNDTGSYLWGGSSLQIVTDAADGWRLSLVAQADDEGTTLQDLDAAGAWPATISLGNSTDDGGWALLYPTTGSSFATENAAGGSFDIASTDGGEVVGCFDFESSDGATTIAVTDGLARVSEFD